MRWGPALAIAVAACGRSTRDECLGVRDAFLDSVRETLAEDSKPPPPPRALDLQVAHAEAAYDAFCATVTDDDWACIQRALRDRRMTPGPCAAVVERFMEPLIGPDRSAP